MDIVKTEDQPVFVTMEAEAEEFLDIKDELPSSLNQDTFPSDWTPSYTPCPGEPVSPEPNEAVGTVLAPDDHTSISDTMYPYRVAVKQEPVDDTDKIDPVKHLETNSCAPTVNMLGPEYCLHPVIKTETLTLATPVNFEFVDSGTISNEKISNICTESKVDSVLRFPKKIKTKQPEQMHNEPSSTKSQSTSNPCERIQKSEKTFYCDLCHKTFPTRLYLCDHMKNHKHAEPYNFESCDSPCTPRNNSSLDIALNSVKKHQCNICEKSFIIERNLKSHMLKHTEAPSKKCDICQKTFKQNNSLKRHMLTHSTEKPHQCVICAKPFNRSSNLKRHMLSHTKNKPYACDICQKTFVHNSALKSHMSSHTGEKPYICDICHKTFVQNSNLKSHMASHTGEKPYVCDICQKSFSCSAYAKRHMLTHSKKKRFQCEICQKLFSRSDHLKQHRSVHAQEKAHQCEICAKKFTMKSNFRKHLLTHVGEKGCRCESCQMLFNSSVDLKKHMLSHSREKAHQCDVCPKSFGRKTSMKRHSATHAGKRRFYCDSCWKSFVKKSNLRRHVVNHRG